MLPGGAAAWPLAAQGQDAGPRKRTGVLLSAGQGDREYEDYIAGFREALEMHGWSEHRNIRIGSKLNLNANAERVRSEQIGPPGVDVLPNPHRECLGRK
jgi:hypothetical protein